MEKMLKTLPRVMIHTPFLSIFNSMDMQGPRKAVTAMGANFPYLKKKVMYMKS